jgi:hypothetical protein
MPFAMGSRRTSTLGPVGAPAPEEERMTIVATAVWQPERGRQPALGAAVATARRIHERLGGRVAVWEPIVGGRPESVTYTVEFDDMAGWGRFADRLAADPEWTAFWAATTSGPHPVLAVVDTMLVAEVDDP